jgi:hypothetical protein
MTVSLKRGKISKEEKEFIVASYETMSVVDMAHKLNRSEAVVRKHIAAVPTFVRTNEQSDWVSVLHAGSFWVEVRKGLIGNEVPFFEKAWAAYSEQFSSSTDILATDELMMKDLIMLDIFSMRAIAEQSNAIRMITELEKRIDAEQEVEPEIRNQLDLSRWVTERNALQIAKTSLVKQHLDYQHRKDAKLKDLKGSRDQRFKQIEENNRNIFELIKELDKQKKRLREGNLNAKIQLAAQRVAADWNKIHEFEDGEFDKPFLSPEGELEDDRLQNEQEEANRQEDA